jgi:tetrapyrrole methylase family protein / MazG family protein
MSIKQNRSGKLFEDLIAIMERLRGPDGCPWDKHQSHASLIKYLFSEAKEVRSAVRKKDWKNLEEELGDVLLQVVFHSQVAREKGLFDITGVIRSINEKLIRRHPHVFEGKGGCLTPKDVVKQWKEIKLEEKAEKKRRSKVH